MHRSRVRIHSYKAHYDQQAACRIYILKKSHEKKILPSKLLHQQGYTCSQDSANQGLARNATPSGLLASFPSCTNKGES